MIETGFEQTFLLTNMAATHKKKFNYRLEVIKIPMKDLVKQADILNSPFIYGENKFCGINFTIRKFNCILLNGNIK